MSTQTTQVGTNKSYNKTFFCHSNEIIIDTLLGIFFGVCINCLADYISRIAGLNFYTTMIIQLLLIILLLYGMKVLSYNLYHSWWGDDSYGIIFISTLFASQRNFNRFIDNLYDY